MERWDRIFRWEFWPYWLFYAPIYVVVLALGFRERSAAFFTAANPGIFLGGFVDYSKWNLHRFMPPERVPRTVLVEAGAPVDEAWRRISSAAIEFPVIVKPDRGERGLGVQKIEDRRTLEQYLRQVPWDTLVQAFVPGDIEFGVLYYRIPDSDEHGVTSLVVKEQLRLTGDGRLSIGQLIDDSDRARPHRQELRASLGARLRQVPDLGEVVTIADIGNHSRGATFRDGNTLIDEALVSRFHEISRRIPGFFFGRYDVKAVDRAAFQRGEFSIIELNGVNSEPAHIYDPENSIWRAYRDLIVHWRLIARISRINRRDGARSHSIWQLIAAIRRHAGVRRRFA